MSHNTWIHRAARVAVRPLAAGPITPNQVTTLRLAVGLVSVSSVVTGEATQVSQSGVSNNQPHDNLQPYLTLNFVIALQGLFPSRN